MSIEIPLTRGYVAIVDEEDAHLAERKWHAVVTTGGLVYATTRNGGGKRIKLHRAIMNPPDDLVVDHINRNTLDNRRSNLRIVEQSVNVRNASRCDDSGVAHTNTGIWFARLKWDTQTVFLGRYKIEEEAYAVVREARSMLYAGQEPKSVAKHFNAIRAKLRHPRADEGDYFARFLADVKAQVAIQKSTQNA